MQAKKNNHAKRTAEQAYLASHQRAQDLVKQIGALLFDLPAAGDDEHPLNWGHVGSMNEVTTRLEAVAAYLNGTEK
jgi:hypothetical protein